MVIPDLADVPALDRKRCLQLPYRTAIAFSVQYQGEFVAAVVASFLGFRTLSPADLEAIHLLRDLVSRLYEKDMTFRNLHNQQEIILGFEREKEMALSAVKQVSFELTNSILAMKKRLRDGEVQPEKAMETLEFQSRALFS